MRPTMFITSVSVVERLTWFTYL